MSVFDDIRNALQTTDSEWVKVVDAESKWTLDDFPYETGANETLTEPHCWRCVTVNNCWFRNEQGKKPARMGYEFETVSSLLGKYGLNLRLGIYHPNCHCQELAISRPTEKQIGLIVPRGKIEWFLQQKNQWKRLWGYEKEQMDELIENILLAVKRAYIRGDYVLSEHSKFGFKILLFISLQGAGKRAGETFGLKSSFTVFPDGRLRCNTLVGGRWR